MRDTVESAAWAEDSKDKRHFHQRRISKDALRKSEEKLLENLDKLESCSSFSELIKTVESKIGDIKGVGPLMVYDTSHRIGAYLDLMPERVYLHCGTEEGAEALGFVSDRDTIYPDEFPDPFQRLEPYEIEDCLCIYKDVLKGEEELESASGCVDSDSKEVSSEGCS